MTENATDQHSAHDDRHERLLEEFLTGDAAAGEALPAELQDCPTCRERLSALRRVTTLLDGAGAEQREILAETVTPRELRREPARRPRWLVPLAAAALALLALAIFVLPRGCEGDRRPDDDLELHGERDATRMAPSGEVNDAADLGHFSWRPDVIAKEPRYRVVVYELDDAGRPTGEPIAKSRRLALPEWDPDAAVVAMLAACRSIRWQVEVEDMRTARWSLLGEADVHRR
ncbi:MAG: hypothetical protein KDE27_08205 [Planctomycetes bacterium]|nr:hypothetical protein [Planctomycetota bacterium]